MGLLFDRYSGIVYSVALRVLKDTGQAEDVMQDIFIQIWKKPGAFISGRGSLGAWLVVVARNRAIDSLRRRRPTDSVEDVVLASSTDLGAEAERNTLMEKVRVYMHQLPPEQRKSVEMAYFEGHEPLGDRREDRRPAGHGEDAHSAGADHVEKGNARQGEIPEFGSVKGEAV